MARKLFYMVRHGESLLNAAHIRQGSEGSLSEKGKEQAAATGKRLAHSQFDVMLVSPYARTKETAEIIAEYVKIKKPAEYVELLVERHNPTEIVNKNANDPQIAHIINLIDNSYHDDDYRYSDEENFSDLKERARRLLAYLSSRTESKLLIVTHSIFLKMVAAYILHQDDLDAKKYNLLSFINSSNNASITVCEYNSGWLGDGWIGRKCYPPEKRWRLVVWDDYTR